MKIRRRAVGYIIVFALGALLFGLNLAGLVDEFWSGMGSGLMAVSLLRLIQLFRLHFEKIITVIAEKGMDAGRKTVAQLAPQQTCAHVKSPRNSCPDSGILR